jgi:small nuclear ribonucleoprotein|tara:strand:+ start:60 stop:374 length:315 start_codon:yes stop_codon:yes gene_type:complete
MCNCHKIFLNLQFINVFRKVFKRFKQENYMDLERPLDALNNARGKRVLLELKNQKQIRGNLKSFDIHINTVLENAEEYENGELKRKLGLTFIRGDTIILISPSE